MLGLWSLGVGALLFYSVVSPAALSSSACVLFSFVSFFFVTAFFAKLQKDNKQERLILLNA